MISGYKSDGHHIHHFSASETHIVELRLCNSTTAVIMGYSHNKTESRNTEDFVLISSPVPGPIKVLLAQNIYYMFYYQSNRHIMGR